eukprot:CAMPEP_0119318580 /NCGR_PEP_ID=MMETSP1333-20130426/46832_1 /TAXON_ID=418940 /ORGANISM="Scyphosphaera apsteinii, Strain RCC1455" /LENGTH=182 /DNA_ID=CAMNT_0007324793 /DNA_START=231 /DNA_END=779 /DNA_ORIENTATION=+
MVRRLEASELKTQQAEALASLVLDAIHAQAQAHKSKFAEKAELVQARLVHEATFEQLRAEVHTQVSGHQSFLKAELERLRIECEKLRTELKHEKEKSKADMRYEIDKLIASQRLDVNLERGRVRDEQIKVNDRVIELDVKIDKQIHMLRTSIEAGKNDLLRYSVATIAALGGLAMGWLRLMM